MQVISTSQARANLKTVLDDVCRDHEPTIVTRSTGAPVVLMSLADYNAMQETLYLLGTTKNTQRLMDSVRSLKRTT